LLLKSISWEVFWDEPWVLDGVFANKVHSVGVAPNVTIFQLEVLIAGDASLSFIFFFENFVESPRMSFDFLINILGFSRKTIEDDERYEYKYSHESEERN
jgi:hypothetical protein